MQNQKQMPQVHNNKIFRERRVELRRNATLAEKKLWFELRNNKLGVKFKRQHSIGGYILDFYCAEKKLIIELDGEVHDTTEAKEYDAVRDKLLSDLGYKTLRFLNTEIDKNIGSILVKIRQNIQMRVTSPLQGEVETIVRER